MEVIEGSSVILRISEGWLKPRKVLIKKPDVG